MFSLKTTEIDIAGPYNTAIGWSNRPATVRHQVAFVHKEKKYQTFHDPVLNPQQKIIDRVLLYDALWIT